MLVNKTITNYMTKNVWLYNLIAAFTVYMKATLGKKCRSYNKSIENNLDYTDNYKKLTLP